MTKRTIHNEKEIQRMYGRGARRALGKGLAAKKSASVASRMLAHPMYQRAKNILAYYAYANELCVEPICETAILQGKNVFYPVTDGYGGMVAAREIYGDGHEEKDRYGIIEPSLPYSKICVPERLDLILVPGVAFDVQGHRLGWGGGYYDRFLPLCKKAIFVGIAFEEQMLEEVPIDPWDMLMDIVVTDQRIYE